MRLTARSPSCFSNKYVLLCDGRPLGEFFGRWFSESLDIRLTDRRHWRLERKGFFHGRFSLLNEQGRCFGTAEHRGLLTSRWRLETSVGECELASAGLFNTGYVIEQHGQTLATIRQINWCEGGWSVHAHDPRLNVGDLVLAGLIYHVILQRRRRNSSNSAAT